MCVLFISFNQNPRYKHLRWSKASLTYLGFCSVDGVVVEGLAQLEGVVLGRDALGGKRHVRRERVTGSGKLDCV